MIVCSIDILNGRAVQLVQGERVAIERDDLFELAERFGRCGEIAVIDLDAAFGRGSNREVIEELCKVARCRVGGGIRDAHTARRYLEAGAVAVILGTAASPELLRQLPRERTIVALDMRDGKLATHGWTEYASESATARAKALDSLCGGFLVTDISRDGTLTGPNVELAQAMSAEVTGRITLAGGVRNVEDIVRLDALGFDAQVGMSIYTGLMDPCEAVVATIDFEKGDGLVPVIACDVRDGRPLMLAYATGDAVLTSLQTGDATYWSRSRQELWRKGATSGNTQKLIRLAVDCDRDALIYYVEQQGAACHTGRPQCFDRASFSWHTLYNRIETRTQAGDGSYTARLLNDSALLDAKITEEAQEVLTATTRSELAWECADLLYFMTVKMRSAGVTIDDVMSHLASRAKG